MQNHTEKQIITFKTTVNWLLNDIWCYLVIGCFGWKIVVSQQTVVRVYNTLREWWCAISFKVTYAWWRIFNIIVLPWLPLLMNSLFNHFFEYSIMLFNDTIRPWCLCRCGFHSNTKLYTNFTKKLIIKLTPIIWNNNSLGSKNSNPIFDNCLCNIFYFQYLLFTSVAALYIIAWSIRCNMYVLSISFKPTATLRT